jgi:hypothetical protein
MSVVGYLLQGMEHDAVAPLRWENLSDADRRELCAPVDDDALNVDDGNALLDALQQDQRDQARAAALTFERVHRFRLHREASRQAKADAAGLFARSLRAEFAAAMRLSERTTESLFGRAALLVEDFPATLTALRQGRITERHATLLVDEGAGLTDEQRAVFEREALLVAERLRAGVFERAARRLRELIRGPELAERHERARQSRGTVVVPTGDGMGALSWEYDYPLLVAVNAKVETIARSLMVEGETRTLQQLKADVLADLLLDAGALLPPGESEQELRKPVKHRGIVPQVSIAATAETAAGESDEPGLLEDGELVDAESTRRLIGCAPTFTRIVTDAHTGAVISFGRTRYKVPADLKRYLRMRDGTCRFVGCTRPAAFCDIDHTVPWGGGGRTDHTNLAHLCRGHHKVKDAGWEVRQDPGGSGRTDWTSPLGREYSTYATAPPGAKWQAQSSWATDVPPF